MANRPNSPLEGTHLVEDWLSNSGVADTTLGRIGWEIAAIGNASTVATVAGVGHPILQLTTAATADGDGEAIFCDPDKIYVGPNGGGFAFAFNYTAELASHNFRIGLHSAVDATAPTDGIWVESNAGVLSLEADSADHGDKSVAVAGVSTLTSGTTAVVATVHVCKVEWSGENAQGGPDTVRLTIDSEEAAEILDCQIDNDESMELKILHWQDSGGADAVVIQIPFFEYWHWT